TIMELLSSASAQEEYKQMEQLQINIAIVGCVSVGKTTLLNALFGKQYSDTKLQRTTMVPQIYQQTDENQTTQNTQLIREANRIHNNKILEHLNTNQFTIDECKPL